MTPLDPIHRVKIYQEIAKRIEAQILDGRLQVGDSLPPERELMSVYQVGRPAVREALMSLQKSGLIAVKTGERARVVRPSATQLVSELSSAVRYVMTGEEGVREFQQARRLFETALVRHAARHASKEDVARIKEALVSNEAALHAGRDGRQLDVARFVETDVEFHFRIAQVAGNSIFSALHAAMVEWLTEQRATSSRVPGGAAVRDEIASRNLPRRRCGRPRRGREGDAKASRGGRGGLLAGARAQAFATAHVSLRRRRQRQAGLSWRGFCRWRSQRRRSRRRNRIPA